MRRGRHGPPLVSVGRNEIRRHMRRQRSVMFFVPSREGWGCRGRTNGMLQDGVATTMARLEILPFWQHMDDLLIANLAVRVVISTRIPSKGGRDERWGSKPKKYEVAEATKMIRGVCQGVSKNYRKGIFSLNQPNGGLKVTHGTFTRHRS